MKKYLPIKIKDVEHLVNSYEKWYGTFDKDGYKYVIEQLNFDDIYYNDILSSLHNFIKGGEFYQIERHKRDEHNTIRKRNNQSNKNRIKRDRISY